MVDTEQADPLRRATLAVYVAFIGAGLSFSTWASRIPQVREDLGLSPGTLGLLLLALAVGAIAALPTSGIVVHRFGSARTFTISYVMACIGLAAAGIGTAVGSVGVVVAGLLCTGLGYGAGDVAMNVEGAEVEHRLGRSIMPRFHAAFSIGTVAGALIGVAMNALGIAVFPHFLVVAAVLVVVLVNAARHFLPAGTEDHPPETEPRHPLAAWREPRTLLIGLFMLCMAIAEGVGNDWIGVAAIDGYGTAAALATVAYAIFLSGMTVVRWFGTSAIDRFGRVPVTRTCAAVTAVGVVIVVFAPTFWIALVGTALWGGGSALGFPIGISAAADDPRRSAGRVSVVASIAYMAFLLSPTVIGFVGERTGVLRALTLVAAAMGIAFLVAGATRPLPRVHDLNESVVEER